MFKGGRPRDSIWEHFTKFSKDKKSYAKCNYCGNEQLAKADRAKLHFAKCTQRDMLNNVISPENDANNQTPYSHDIPNTSHKRDRSASPPRKRQAVPVTCTSVQPNLNGTIFKTTAKVKTDIDNQLAKFFYACNIPFNVVEHPEFIKTVKLLRPGYTPPTRKVLGGQLLDKITEDMQAEMKEKIDGKSGSIAQDGWSNCHNDPIIATTLIVDGKSYFLDSCDTGSMSKSAENCKKLCDDSMQTAKEKYNCSVKSVVTDNASNMAKMRAALKADDPELTVYGCSAHLLNLLGEDLTPKDVMTHVKDVNKYFRNHQKPSAWLNAIDGSVKPQLPGDTRWKSQLLCVETFTKNRPYYLQICEENECEFDRNIIHKVQDYNIYRNAKDLAAQLQPIAVALDTCQSDQTSIADACHVWLSLLENPVLSQHRSAIDRRFKQAITTEHLTAYKLHPKYLGEKLSHEQSQIVSEYLLGKSEVNAEVLIAFEAKSAPFPAHYFTEKGRQVPPTTWWKGAKNSAVPSVFVDTAINLLSCPCSSASIERVFSSFGAVHSKVRNRLGNDKASKLVFCYRMLRGGKELDY